MHQVSLSQSGRPAAVVAVHAPALAVAQSHRVYEYALVHARIHHNCLGHLFAKRNCRKFVIAVAAAAATGATATAHVADVRRTQLADK